MGAGAGSGYITNSNIKFPDESFKVFLRVGGPGEASVIKTNIGSDITANPGCNSTNNSKYSGGIGGNGFSGGEY